MLYSWAVISFKQLKFQYFDKIKLDGPRIVNFGEVSSTSYDRRRDYSRTTSRDIARIPCGGYLNIYTSKVTIQI